MAKKRNLPLLLEDKVEFFEKILKIKPFLYQGEFLQDPAALKVLRWPRRAGKTMTMSGDDLYFGMPKTPPTKHDPKLLRPWSKNVEARILFKY